MKIRKYFVFLLGLTAAAAARGDASFVCGPWHFTVGTKGEWKSLAFENRELLARGRSLPAWSVFVSADAEDPLESLRAAGQLHIAANAQEPAKGKPPSKPAETIASSPDFAFKGAHREGSVVSLEFASSTWRVTERIIFSDGADGSLPRFERVLAFENLSDVERKFHKTELTVPFRPVGRYLLPAMFFGYQNELPDAEISPLSPPPPYPREAGRGEVAKLKIGQSVRPYNRARGFVYSPTNDFSVLIFNWPRQEVGDVSLIRKQNDFTYACTRWTRGYAEPHREQVVLGDVFAISKREPDAALHVDFPRFLKEVGVHTPADRPDWVNGASVVEFSPIQHANPAANDGARVVVESIAPRVAALGFNTAWSMPVTHGASLYSPADFFGMHQKFGDTNDYARMVDAFHRHHVRFLQDIVPHGGRAEVWSQRPIGIANAVFTAEGNVLNYWGMDFADPAWRDYMAKLASFYCGMGADGFRVDAPFGSFRPNWRHPLMTRCPDIVEYLNNTKVVDHIEPDYWKRMLAAHGGAMPRVPYMRASLSQNVGGVGMVEAIRNAARRANPENVALSEIFGLPFTDCSDLLLDMTWPYLVYRIRNLSPSDFVAGLSRWLDERACITPADAILLRYNGSHDQLYTPHWVGLDAWQALTAATFFAHGAPLIFFPSDRGSGAFLRRMNALRAQRTELQGGRADYRVLCPSAPEVFAVRREKGGSWGAGFINFSPKSIAFTWTGGTQLLRLEPWESAYLEGESGRIRYPSRPDAPATSAANSVDELLAAVETSQCDVSRSETNGVVTLRLRARARAALARLKFASAATHYTVHTLEGRYEDFILPDAAAAFPGAAQRAPSRVHRLVGTETLWDGDRSPLDPENPVVNVSDAAGRHLYVSFGASAATAYLAEKFDGEAGLNLVVEPDCGQEIVLNLATRPFPKMDPARVRLTGESLAYRVRNGHYDLRLNRHGGGILSWDDANGTRLGGYNEIYSTNGWVEARTLFVSGYDLDTSCRVRHEGEALVMTFSSHLRDRRRRRSSPLIAQLEYRFDATPVVRCRTRVCAGGSNNGRQGSPHLGWSLWLSEAGKNRLRLSGGTVMEGTRRVHAYLPAKTQSVRKRAIYTWDVALADGVAVSEPSYATAFDPYPSVVDLSFAALAGFTDDRTGQKKYFMRPGESSGVSWSLLGGSFIKDPQSPSGIALAFTPPDPYYSQALGKVLEKGTWHVSCVMNGSHLSGLKTPRRTIDWRKVKGDGVPRLRLRLLGERANGSFYEVFKTFDLPRDFEYRSFSFDAELTEDMLAPSIDLTLPIDGDARVRIGGFRVER